MAKLLYILCVIQYNLHSFQAYGKDAVHSWGRFVQAECIQGSDTCPGEEKSSKQGACG